MLATAFLRLGLRQAATPALRNSSTGGLTRCVPLAHQRVMGFATVTSASTTTKTTRARKTTPSTTTAKAAKKTAKKVTKAVKKPVKKAVKKVAKPKDKPWEARDASGKLIPLPSATKPKKTSAYGVFVQSRTKEAQNDPAYFVKNKDGVDKFSAVKMVRQIGAEWKAMSEAEKRPFNQQAEESKASYETALQAWRESLTAEDIRRQNSFLSHKKKTTGKTAIGRLRDPAKPKVAPSAFFEFLKEVRQRNGTTSVIETAKAGGVEWKAMSKEQKEPYERKVQGAKEQYQREMADYKQAQA